MKRVIVFLTMMLVLTGLVFSAGEAESKEADAKPTIGIILKSFSNPFWLMAKTSAEAEADLRERSEIRPGRRRIPGPGGAAGPGAVGARESSKRAGPG